MVLSTNDYICCNTMPYMKGSRLRKKEMAYLKFVIVTLTLTSALSLAEESSEETICGGRH